MAKVKFIFNVNVYLIRGIVESECDQGEEGTFPWGRTATSALNCQEVENVFSLDRQH